MRVAWRRESEPPAQTDHSQCCSSARIQKTIGRREGGTAAAGDVDGVLMQRYGAIAD